MPTDNGQGLGLGLIAASFDAPMAVPTTAAPDVPRPAAYPQLAAPALLSGSGATDRMVMPAGSVSSYPAAQQPSVVYVPERTAIPMPVAPLATGPAPSRADSAPLVMKRFDNWVDPTCRQSCDWAGGGCRRCPCYLRGEYLLWWLTGDKLPPLVTTSPAATPPLQAGVLGQPDTTVLFGDQAANASGRSGARLTLGMWLNPSARLELEWFGLGGQHTAFNQSSGGDPILATPFHNLSTGVEDAYLFAYPGLSQGSISIREISYFTGAGFHIMRDFWSDQTPSRALHRFGGLYGFRYLGLYEKLSIDSFTDAAGGSTTFDAFRTTNNFYGGNFGLYGERYSGRWTLATVGRLAFGTTSQHANITGTSTALSAAYPAGLLALPSNMGSYVHDLFTVIPQLELKLAFAITPRWRLTAGYDLIYWNRAARPGQQIDTSLNPTQLSGTVVGTPGPVFKFHEGDLLIQGVSGGLEFHY